MSLKKVTSINTNNIKQVVLKDIIVDDEDGIIHGNINLNLI